VCGIAGISWRDGALVRRMSAALAHRGPDAEGFHVEDRVSLGHRRLSIIDLSEAGRQPMAGCDGLVRVVYNGEIYNFAEIRRDLEARGHRFRSQTDTEVIVHAYEEDGADCVRRFNGMFAFAVWDGRSGELVLARDRLGVKPLYYWLKDGRLAFASEIKALLEVPDVSREVDPQALYHYVGYEFVPAPETIFRDVKKLPPAHHARFRDGGLDLARYWDLPFEVDPRPVDEIVARMRDLLADAVRLRLVADVPLGVFLSGGLDSSTVVALMHRAGVRPIQSFSLGYDDPTFSELPYARLVAGAFGTVHRELIVEPVTPRLIETVAWHLDEPMTDLSTIPFYLICGKAREHVTVCLSGEGGDEVLVGYDRFRASKLHRYYARLPKRLRHDVIAPLVARLPDQAQKKGPVNLLKRFIEGGLLPEEGEHMRWQFFGTPAGEGALFAPEFRREIAADPFAPIRRHLERFRSDDRLAREIYVDLVFTMPDSVLMKVDKSSMAHALEVRVPFLDYRFVEFCATIPSDLKLAGLTTKAVFRRAVRGILPDAIRRRGKQGYSLPIKNWLRRELRDYTRDLLLSSPLVRRAFDVVGVRRLLDEHEAYRANHNHVLWALVNLAVWHRLFVEERRPAIGRATAAGVA
jgi:asparagine synthase (glutamine-hydrolysing)